MNNPIDIEKFIADLKNRQRQLLDHYDNVSAELEEVSDQLKMAEAVRDQLYEYFRLEPATDRAADEKLRLKYAHLTIKDMLIQIAIESDGILDLVAARKILVRAGVFKDERNAATSIAPITSRHEDIFKRVARGIYVLQQAKPCRNLVAHVPPVAINSHSWFRQTEPRSVGGSPNRRDLCIDGAGAVFVDTNGSPIRTFPAQSFPVFGPNPIGVRSSGDS